MIEIIMIITVFDFFFTPFLLFMPVDNGRFCNMFAASQSQNRNIIKDHPIMFLGLFSLYETRVRLCAVLWRVCSPP